MRRAALRSLALAGLATSFVVLPGCATHARMEDAARSAATQVAVLRDELGRKVESEESYYGSVRARARSRIQRTRLIDLEDQLTRTAESFARSNRSVTASKLEGLMKSFSSAWQGRERHRAGLLAKLDRSLAANREKLEVADGSLAGLHNKLRALSEARTNGELARFLVGYVREVRGEYSRLEQDAEAAARAASAADAEVKAADSE